MRDVKKDVIRICKYHGELTIEDVKPENKRGGIYYRCHKCKLIKDQKWKVVHREQHIEASIRWKKNNREHVNAWTREDRLKNPDKYKEWEKASRARQGDSKNTKEIVRIRGVSLKEYEAMFINQDNKCAICNQPETRKSRTDGKICRLALDHCHKTGKIRALLCHACNIMIGKAGDDINILQKSIIYLQSHKHIDTLPEPIDNNQ